MHNRRTPLAMPSVAGKKNTHTAYYHKNTNPTKMQVTTPMHSFFSSINPFKPLARTVDELNQH